LQNCLRGPNPLYSDKLNAAIRSYKSSLAFWQTIISGAESKANLFDQPVSPDEQHTDKPLVVMTALNAYGDVETDDRQALEAAQHQTHEALVQSSNLGKRIMIEESSHDIQFDRPDAVLNVILEILESE